MRTLKSSVLSMAAFALLMIAVLGCRELSKQPDWTRAKKINANHPKLSHISGLVIDDRFAYVTIGGTLADQQAGTSGLRKIALDSGEITMLDDGLKNLPQSDRGGLALDDQFIYWNGGGKILRLPKEGGVPETIVSDKVGIGADIVVDKEKIYWANHSYYSPNSPTKPSPIFSVKKSGGPIEIFIDEQMVPHSLVLDESFVYWATPESVLKKSKAGGNAITIFQATDKEGVDELTQDSESLYFGFRAAGKSRWSLRKISKQGGSPQTIANTFTLGQTAIDDKNVYFFDEENLYKEVLCKIPKSGGEISRLDVGYSNGTMAQGQTAIYFTTGEDLYSFPK